jgi:ATP-dependent Lhr-like helicase
VLEALRECVREVFDLDALAEVLGAIRAGRVQVVTVDSVRPSPFAAALLFGYVASYLYDGDAPLAERRAQALTIDTEQLRAILGEVELRTLLDPGVIADVQASLQSLDEGHRAHGEDSLHDLLLRVGDLSVEEIALRCDGAFSEWVRRLEGARRIVPVSIAGERRFIAAEDAARVRDGLGAKLPRGLPDALLAPAVDASVDLVRRYARTHGPFTVTEVAARLGLSEEEALRVTRILLARGRLAEGSLSPRSSARELCDVDVLATLRRRSLAKVHREIEPVDVPTYTRMLLEWSGVTRKRREESALAFAIERLQGARLAASVLERDLLPARVDGYRPEMLDAMIASGEVVWCGAESLGERDGRIQFFLASEARALHLGNPRRGDDELGELADRERAIVLWLESRGASFFEAIHEGAGGGYPRDTIDALWQLVWRGIVTNDSLYALRAFVSANARTGPRAGLGTARMLRSPLRGGTGGRSRVRGFVPPEAAGRWSLWASRIHGQPSTTEWAAATAEQLLLRYGIVTREAATAEQIPGGFAAIYDVLSALEAAGRIRRGYFVVGLGAAQFALPEALDLLRSMRSKGASGDAVVVSATDPANPYGALCEWPRLRAPARVSGAYVVLVDGVAAAFLSRHGAEVQLHLPRDEPARARVIAAVAAGVLQLAHRARSLRHPFLIEQIDGADAREHAAVAAFTKAGLRLSTKGLSLPNDARGVLPAAV